MVRPYLGRLIWAILCMVFTAGLNSGIALMVKPLMDDIFVQKRWIMLQIIPVAILLLYFLKATACLTSSWETCLPISTGFLSDFLLRGQQECL